MEGNVEKVCEKSEEKVYYGVVCWFNKSYGFITPDESDVDIFCHFSDITCEGFKIIYKDQRVSYSIGTNNRNQPKAINVKVIK